jgi:hypothetical protein
MRNAGGGVVSWRDLVMTRGDSRTFDFSDVEDTDGMAFNLAGATLNFTVDGLFTLTRGAGIVVDESSGSIEVDIEPANTEDATDHRHDYRYELEITLADESVHTPRKGRLILTPDLDVVE